MTQPRISSPFVLLSTLVATLCLGMGCRAQVPVQVPIQGIPLTAEQARRVEVLVRQKANLPPGSIVNVGPRIHSDTAGFDTVSVTITNDGNVSHPIPFLLSADGKTLAQFTKYDISADPRSLVSVDGRPARGGPDSAPVLIVGFDDLECPYCARLHSTIFPAIVNRYGDKVRIVYKDFPLEQHPWAMHAAVDVNCLGAQDGPGYWNLVDTVHAHASDITAAAQASPDKDKAVGIANSELDTLTLTQGKNDKVDLSKLNVCLQAQDTKAIEASVKVGTSLGVDSTPALFINGAKIDGALPIEFIFGAIDEALKAENVIPPPPYVAPPPPAEPAPATPAPSAKPGK